MNRFDLIGTPLAGRNLIEASAGTGKTFAIAGVFLRLVLELRLPVGEILVVTFTEAATKELRERIRKRLKEAELAFESGETSDPLLDGLLERCADRPQARRLLANALRCFDEAAIFTIHGFCQRTLQENPFESGSLCDTELLTDQAALLSEIAQDYWRINCYGAPLERIAAAHDAGLSPDALLSLARRLAADPFASVIPAPPQAAGDTQQWLLTLRRGFFDFLASELPGRKRLKNVRSFDDLLLDLHAAVTRPGSSLPALIRGRYKAALIDEFQDTDPVQFAIFDSIFPVEADTPFFLIGDPKQAIYSFRGADIFAYIGAAQATEKRHTLVENWRSEPSLIRGVNTLFASHQAPFLFEEIPFSPVQAAPRQLSLLSVAGDHEPPLKLWFTPRREPGKPINKGEAGELLPETVASEIARLLRQGDQGTLKIGERRVVPGDIAVLVRANRQAKQMQRALTRRGIPSVLCSAGNLFESEEASELLTVLAAVSEPGHEALLRGALATDLSGVSGSELASLAEDERAWEEVLEEFRGYHEIWAQSGCLAMMLRFLERRRVRGRLLGAPLGERRLTNVLHLVETIHQAQIEGRLGMEGVLAWLSCRITEQPKREEHEIRLETDEAAVQIVTIHKSKGLEYPIVFLPFSWAEYAGKDPTALFHAEDGSVVLDIGSERLSEHQEIARRESLAESLRLLYVALTRGKHRTYLVWGAFKDAGDSALHYLLHPEAPVSRGQVTLSDQALLDQLGQLAERSQGAIEVLALPDPDQVPYQPPPEPAAQFEVREFTGSIPREWRVASFTSLASHQHQGPGELPDRDEGSSRGQAEPGGEASGIFAFPKGAKAGIFLHEIFELLDFARLEGLEELVSEQLAKHAFDPQWHGAVCSMVRSVLAAPLGKDGFALHAIGTERRLSELEFFFPLTRVTSERLREAVTRLAGLTFPVDLAGLFGRLSFAPLEGMLRGFMDLVIEHGGRYYILDWKSNHLGNHPGAYNMAGMRREMEESCYPLQYLLYTVALDNYLRLRVPGYRYEEHFGGIFYIFLRGVDGTGNGIFADRPPRRLIEELSEALLGSAHHEPSGHQVYPAPAKPVQTSFEF
ncbi:hypothetical protein GMST_33250 [Geomonas silvestris]|uniref:DNA 3'-5' helicase n=1 Tax=Geomonas silvestris TaxID=2740184 RepID=A0A6V8MLU7_9BACT|nr:exodeoxyribonuclease V subunit beta [Geomonas silvestris]GFO61000.1 hypothetical protein GMST_33250 [Geomonas silvestris]